MKTKTHTKRKGQRLLPAAPLLGVIRPNQNQNQNDLAVQDGGSSYSLGNNASLVICEDALEHGVRPVLSLLGMMQCPDHRISILDKTNPDRDLLLAIESLWLSQGHPMTGLWRRLLLYFRDTDMVCSYNKTLTPNEKS